MRPVETALQKVDFESFLVAVVLYTERFFAVTFLTLFLLKMPAGPFPYFDPKDKHVSWTIVEAQMKHVLSCQNVPSFLNSWTLKEFNGRLILQTNISFLSVRR